MKNLIAMIGTIFLMACQIENTPDIDPALAKVVGKWQLYKIAYGFPPPQGPTETQKTNQETIEFDINNKTVTRSVSGKITENSAFELKQISDGGASLRDAIVFTKSGTYSFISFDEATSSLILNQAAPVGAILADGNLYYYQKVK